VPELTLPRAAVRQSYLAGMRAMCAEESSPTSWLDDAGADFAAFVAERRLVRRMWGVPVTELWYLDGRRYIGTVMIRHDLTPQLRRDGGNIGYHVVPGYRGHGHATAMLSAACSECGHRGMSEVLLTCSADNVGSRRVIEANGGVLKSRSDGVLRYLIDLRS